MNRLIPLHFLECLSFLLSFFSKDDEEDMVSQVLRREKLDQSEKLTNFPRLIQAWAGPLGDVPAAPREAAAAAAPACCSGACVL